MKKTFKLTAPNKVPERHQDSIRHEIKKYIARERRKTVPDNIDFWDFDCRFGDNEQEAKSIQINEINTMINQFVAANKESFYLEILARPGHKTKK